MRASSLFVYYKVESARAEQLKARVQSMQHALKAQYPQLDAKMLVRVDAHPHQTWLEVYQHPDGIDSSLQREIDRAALSIQTESFGQLGPRHVEVFAACA
ncbi:MAG TPA: DUF4936 family protein [Aquabacterium sp.]|nr:DUF4936 family protein [Aquabacterium sp.]